jgi:hypothetical protein
VATQPTVEFERRRKAAKAEQTIEGLFDVSFVLTAGAQDGLNEGRVLTHRLSIDRDDFGGKLRDAIGYRINCHANGP